MSVFFNEKGKLRKKLLLEEAKEWAKKLNYHQEENGRRSDVFKVSINQLRKFYNEVLALQAKIKASSYEDVEALIAMLISKANYSKVRDKNNKMLFEFINHYVSNIKSEKDFDAFVTFFEAVIGFFPRKN